MYELIEHRRLDGAASSITFSSIPQNYSDLAIFVSTRINEAGATGEAIYITLNGSTANFTNRYLQGTGSSVENGQLARYVAGQPALLSTANTFGNGFIHIANYSGGTNKIISGDSVSENNGTTAFQVMNTNLWSNTAPITEITLVAGTNDSFVANSSATLYGVNRRAGIGRAPLAMGGYMSYSNGYWVHTFPSSGSFIPFTNMDVEYLVIAGGGGGGYNAGGGGGAGGYRSSVIGELSGANSATESRLSLTANTNYNVIVGAGGAGGGSGSTAGNSVSGNDSSFAGVVSLGGGRGAGNGLQASVGGSGGGAGFGGTGAAGTAGQGFAGGSHNSSSNERGGGGGAGEAGNTNSVGAGGDGMASTITGSSVIRAGGGGGGSTASSSNNIGGDGGGGAGGDAENNPAATAGTANTGGGGGGGASFSVGWAGAAGGSGIVIVRYRA